jgi:hypothetical protein
MSEEFFVNNGFKKIEEWFKLNGFEQTTQPSFYSSDDLIHPIEFSNKEKISVTLIFNETFPLISVNFYGIRGEFNLYKFLEKIGRLDKYDTDFYQLNAKKRLDLYLDNLIKLFETDLKPWFTGEGWNLKLNFNHLDDLGLPPK